MKAAISLLGLLLFMQTSYGQLYISPGATVQLSGNCQLTLLNTDLINEGILAAGTSTVSFYGNNISSISGSGPVVFNNMEINKTNAAYVLMQSPFSIANSLLFSSGNLELNGNNVDLGSSGILVGEQENSRITGSNGGQVLFSTTLNNPSSANPGNLGAVITSNQNLGTVLIRRGHKSQVNNYGNGNSIQRYFDIVPANNAALNATLRFNYFDAELNGIPENGLVFWNSTDNLHWANQGFTSRNTTANYVIKNNIASFSRWTLSSINNPLPVTFTLFNLKCEGDRILLNWKTAQEQNSSYFRIERSTDGTLWTVIGNLPAAGNSSTEKNYSFNDNNPVQNSYYRVAQVDVDGKLAYTNVLRSPCSVKDIFTVGPNPFTDRIFISLSAEKQLNVEMKLFDSKGALVKKQDAMILNGINQLTLKTDFLPAGAYTLVVEWGSGQLKKAIHVIKQ